MKLFKLATLVLLINFGMQAQELVTGKATLTELKNDVYEITKKDGTKKTIDLKPNAQEFVPGVLSVLFKDCEQVRLAVFELVKITEQELINMVTDYNNCNYSPFKPTENEAENAANFQGDKFALFASVGASVNRTSFFNTDDSENLTQTGLAFGIAATPGFLGTLQGNLYITLEVGAGFSATKDFGNAPHPTDFKKDSQRANLGLEYHFNKNGTLIPVAGIGVGIATDHYKGNYNGYDFNERDGSTFAIPKVGLLYALDNKKSLGLLFSYIPAYTNDLSFRVEDEIIPLFIDTSFINAGLYFYF